MQKLLSLSALSVLVPVMAACSGAESAHDPSGDPGESTGAFVWHATPLVNPCDLSWRLPTVDWSALQPAAWTYEVPFYQYEKELFTGNSLWFGRYSSADGAYHRAIVQVDLIRDTDKKQESKLWFVALIPYVPPPDPMTTTMTAIYRYRATPPVKSVALGYCLDDNSFLENRWNAYGLRTPAPVVPAQKKIKYVVTMYDPRCTCVVPMARTTAIVSSDVFAAAM